MHKTVNWQRRIWVCARRKRFGSGCEMFSTSTLSSLWLGTSESTRRWATEIKESSRWTRAKPKEWAENATRSHCKPGVVRSLLHWLASSPSGRPRVFGMLSSAERHSQSLLSQSTRRDLSKCPLNLFAHAENDEFFDLRIFNVRCPKFVCRWPM